MRFHFLIFPFFCSVFICSLFHLSSPPALAIKPKDTSYKRFQPSPPSNAEARSASLEWTPEDDQRLYILARQYSTNWDLVAHVFNTATRRPKTDERLAWDCFDRWTKRWGPQPVPPQPGSAASQGGSQLLSASTSSQLQPGLAPPSAALPAAAPAPAASTKKDKKSAASAAAAQAAQAAPLTAATKPPEMSRAQLRRAVMLEATKKAQKKREAHLKASRWPVTITRELCGHDGRGVRSHAHDDIDLHHADILPAVRKVNLSAHETHNQPIVPLSALDLSKLKAERERAQLEELRKREQAKLYQQAQQAAMAQQQQQMQAQAQAQQRGVQLPQGVSTRGGV